MTGIRENRASYQDWPEWMSGIDALAGDNQFKPSPGSGGKGRDGRMVRFVPESRDVIVQCPKCKTLETLQFVESTLTPCRKFSQKDGHVYHDCGSDQPCRLHG